MTKSGNTGGEIFSNLNLHLIPHKKHQKKGKDSQCEGVVLPWHRGTYEHEGPVIQCGLQHSKKTEQLSENASRPPLRCTRKLPKSCETCEYLRWITADHKMDAAVEAMRMKSVFVHLLFAALAARRVGAFSKLPIVQPHCTHTQGLCS